MKRRLFSLFLALVMCLSLLPTAAFAEGDTDTTDPDGGTTTGTTTTGETGDTTTTTTGGKDSATAAPTGKDEEDATAAPTPVVQSLASPPVVLAAGITHTNSSHCLCGAAHNTSYDHSASLSGEWKLWPDLLTGSSSLATSLPTDTQLYYLTDNVVLENTWELSGETTVRYLCLNGHTITLNKDGPVITVSNGATLVLTDCAATPGTITHAQNKTGSGVYVESGGTFNLYNGSITGNSGTSRTDVDGNSGNCGGGVYIAPGGTVTMYGGSITGNTAASGSYAGGGGGGGVYIAPSENAPGGKFTMSGGSITNDTVTSTSSFSGGGGVFVGDYGAFTMTGGTISGNSATKGGGVYVYSGLLHLSDVQVTFTMSGGSITGNNATTAGGGVYGGAFHGTTGSDESLEPNETAQAGSKFEISGTASVTGNTLGGTKGTDGKYTGGTANNMFVPSWVYSIHVANGFTGSFGVTVGENDWTDEVSTTTNIHGTYWKVVRYEDTGSSSTAGGGNITYDNERFTFHSKGTVNAGKVTCNHLCEANRLNGVSTYKCSFCGSNSVEAEVTLADGTTKRCYENLPAAIEKAGNNGMVKLLKNVTIGVSIGSSSCSLKPGAGNTVKLDLNGKAYKITAGDSVTIANGTLEITDSTSSSSGSIGNLKVANGAKLIVEEGNDANKQPEINSLTVQSGGAAQLKGGKYGSITAPEGKTCNELLADGYAFFRSGSPLDGSANNFPAVEEALITIGSHTCDGFNDGKCNACGRACPHSSIDTDGKCTACTMQMVAQVTKTVGSSEKTAYFTGFEDAVDSIKAGDTNVTIKLLADHAVSTDLTIDKACTLDLNRQTLTINTEEKLTVNSTVTIRSASDAIIVEGGEIAGEVVAGASAELTIEGDLTISNLTAAVSATVQLKGGTYGYISIEEEGAAVSEKTIASLLAPGYAFASTTTESDEPRNLYSSLGKGGQYLTVVQCVKHGVTDESGNKCIFCNTAFAVSVKENTLSAPTHYCQTLSEAMAYINGKTNNVDNVPNNTIYIKLLGDVTETEGSTKTITLDRRNPLELNLNGKTLTANITVANSTTLTMHGSGTLAGTLDVLSGGSAKLFNGTFNKIKVADGSSVNALLGENCGYYSTDAAGKKTWLMSGDTSLNGTSLENISVQKIPIKSVTIDRSGTSSIPYGRTTTLTATAIRPEGVTAEPTYSWSREKVGGTTTSGVGSAATLTVKGSELDAGEYDFSCTVTVDGYSLESNVRITVNKATLSSDKEPTAKTGLTFQTTNAAISEPKPQQLVTAPTSLPTGCTVYYRLGTTGDFTTTIPTATNAGTYTVQWYITGNDNYYDTGSKTAPQSLTVEIKPMKVGENVPAHNPEGINQLSIKHWDSQRQIWCTDGTLTYTYTGEPIEPTIRLETPSDYVIPESGYSVEYKNNTIATTLTSKPTIIIKDTDPNDNFQIMESEFTFTIEPKTVELNPNTYTHYAERPLGGGSITFGLKDIAEAMGMPTNDGELKFLLASEPAPTGPAEDTDISMEITSENALKISDAVLTGDTPYTATIKVSSNNHKGSFTLNIVVSRKIVLDVEPTSPIEKGYDGTPFTAAQAGAHFDLVNPQNGKRITAGTWKWEGLEGSDTGPTNVADSGKYMLTFTPTNSDDFSAVTTTVQVTINPRSLADSGITATADGGTYTGEPITPMNLTVTYKTADGRTLTLTEGTDYTVSGDTRKTGAGTYSLTITGKGNYTGTKTVKWTIAPKPLEDDTPANGTLNRHDPIRRQPLFISTIGGSGNASGSAGGSSVTSPDTGDAGIALYGVLTVLSLTGGAWLRRKKF